MKIQDLAYVLHRRPYRETSFLVDFFTQQHGVVTAVCRGIRSSKKTLSLECFHPFWIEYSQRHQLASLYQWELMESTESRVFLTGMQLYCGFYINELLIRLLGHHDPYPEVFALYQETLRQLTKNDQAEKALRIFEFYLLRETGYGIALEHEVEGHELIIEEKSYYYNPGIGFRAMHVAQKNIQSSFIFDGKMLLEMAENNFTEQATLKAAKRLIRLTLNVLLEKKEPLKSRSLLQTHPL